MGLSLGLGPMRVGIGNRGLGYLVAMLFILAALIWLATWPYRLGTWIAVDRGAVEGSAAATALGWTLEALYLTLVPGAYVRGKVRAHRARSAQAAAELRRSLVNAAWTSKVLAERLQVTPRGTPDAELPAGHRLLMRFDEVALVEPRVAHRGGPRVLSSVDHGVLLVSDRGLTFTSATKKTRWQFDKILSWSPGGDFVTFNVSNRQLISGVSLGPHRQGALQIAVEWGMALGRGLNLSGLKSDSETLMRRDAATLAGLGGTGAVAD